MAGFISSSTAVYINLYFFISLLILNASKQFFKTKSWLTFTNFIEAIFAYIKWRLYFMCSFHDLKIWFYILIRYLLSVWIIILSYEKYCDNKKRSVHSFYIIRERTANSRFKFYFYHLEKFFKRVLLVRFRSRIMNLLCLCDWNLNFSFQIYIALFNSFLHPLVKMNQVFSIDLDLKW